MQALGCFFLIYQGRRSGSKTFGWRQIRNCGSSPEFLFRSGSGVWSEMDAVSKLLSKCHKYIVNEKQKTLNWYFLPKNEKQQNFKLLLFAKTKFQSPLKGQIRIRI
jgi:hypothetical protein